jgi:hypothetical protein
MMFVYMDHGDYTFWICSLPEYCSAFMNMMFKMISKPSIVLFRELPHTSRVFAEQVAWILKLCVYVIACECLSLTLIVHSFHTILGRILSNSNLLTILSIKSVIYSSSARDGSK